MEEVLTNLTIFVYEGENCYKPSGNRSFLKCVTYIVKKDFTKQYFEFIQSYERKTNVMASCRIREFCERCIKYIGISDVGSKRILPRTVNQRNIC